MLPPDVVEKMGFESIGKNVQISDRASFYGIGRIRIGDHTRIDDFCVLSAGEGGIQIGNFVHIAVYTSLIGAETITISDFCNLSSRVSIYSSSDDYSGNTLTNPTIPDAYKKVKHAAVFLGKHVIVGCGAVILPGVVVGEGVAIGALSRITKNCDPFSLYDGVRAKKIMKRKRNVIELEKLFMMEYNATVEEGKQT